MAKEKSYDVDSLVKKYSRDMDYPNFLLFIKEK